MELIKIGTRGSDLALWQAYHVKAQLEALGCQVEINIIKTQGDQIQHLSFDKLEGKGFFTKEIEDALLNESVDLAVHSHKDLETNQPEGLEIVAVSEREDPSDILLIKKESVDKSKHLALKEGAIVGSCLYATYALTCWSVFKGFHAKIVIADVLWGGFIYATTSLSTIMLMRYLKS